MKLVIYGNGAMAQLLFSYARHSMEVCGFTVDNECITQDTGQLCGVPLVPFDSVERVFDPARHRMIVAVGFLEMNAVRERKHDEAAAKGYSFTSYVHDSVMQHDDVVIEDDCVVLDHVSIHPGCRIGRGTFVSSNVNIGHNCTVKAFGFINAGVSIAGGCEIGERCFIGVNASTSHGIRLGARNFIAANTLVNRSTEDDQVFLSEAGQLHRLGSGAFLKFSRLVD